MASSVSLTALTALLALTSISAQEDPYLGLGPQPDYTNYDPNLEFNLTLNDMQGIYNWDVAAMSRASRNGGGDINDPLPRGAWSVSFSNSSWTNYVPGMVGLGESEHRVTINDSEFSESFTIPIFVGTRFTVLGNLDGSQWSEASSTPPLSLVIVGPGGEHVATNNVTAEPTPGVLGSVAYSAPGDMAAELNCYSGTVAIKGVTITAKMVSAAPSFADVDRTVLPFVVNGSASPHMQYTGPWNVSTHIGGVGGQPAIAYPHMQGFNNSEVTFQIPRNTSFMYINGTLGPTARRHAFTLNPGSPSGLISGGGGEPNMPWVVPYAIVYMVLLDPTVQYNISIKPVMFLAPGQRDDTPGDRITLHSATFFSALSNKTRPATNATNVNSSTTSSLSTTSTSDTATSTSTPLVATSGSKMSRGAIAGTVIGVVVAVALVAALAAWAAMRRLRRRTQTPSKASRDGFVIDESETAGSDSGLVERPLPPLPEKEFLSEQEMYPGGGISWVLRWVVWADIRPLSTSGDSPISPKAAASDTSPAAGTPTPPLAITTSLDNPPSTSPQSAMRSPRPLPTPVRAAPTGPRPPLERVRVQQERDGGRLPVGNALPGYPGSAGQT